MVGAEHLAGRDAKRERVADIAGGARDGNSDWLFHDELPRKNPEWYPKWTRSVIDGSGRGNCRAELRRTPSSCATVGAICRMSINPKSRAAGNAATRDEKSCAHLGIFRREAVAARSARNAAQQGAGCVCQRVIAEFHDNQETMRRGMRRAA